MTVARVAFALPIELEDRLAPDAVRHGHDIVARLATAGELASRLEQLQPDVVVVAATERHLTERLLSICDEVGVRVIALVASEAERKHATAIGLLETVDAASGWAELESSVTALGVARAES
ncbi:MAG: tyrosine-protein kinase family protein, partial [Glaciihabitans sp.]|nr:tyrosine-protein kinase family protein [Glaciihabitans sp.]